MKVKGVHFKLPYVLFYERDAQKILPVEKSLAFH